MISEEEREFNRVRKEYYARFKQAYGIVPGDVRPLSEHIRVMKEAIETGIMPPLVKEGVVGLM